MYSLCKCNLGKDRFLVIDNYFDSLCGNKSGQKVSHLNKENEMLEGSVEVSLLLQLHHRVKMLVVDVSVNPE